MQNKRTLWPLGILLIIFLGIILITASVRISSIQSIAPDSAFGYKKLFVDENINELMNIQNRFEGVYTSYLGINNLPIIDSLYKINNPYYVKPPAPKTTPQDNIRLTEKENVLFLLFVKDIKHSLQAYPLIESIKLDFVRLDNHSKDVKSIAVSLHPYEDENLGDLDIIFKSDSFSLPLKGFYQARFEVDVKFFGDNETKKVFFYHWLFNN
ncbi:hypothetical protein LS73_001550 [Helicobacter muridarum]|uniref:Uncharacterized protein n=1 Tax=Helicobacter muridarum TaxID=216 RepID=A0A099TXL9_9HELI|nr:hypothetical protein [Helicobacter muridarum]TLE01393.1 hypothetical protein LS73_001550 [Helicobacter muridarum]STQ85322.1 Uncharacterised protein [Helicobacter muridarum]